MHPEVRSASPRPASSFHRRTWPAPTGPALPFSRTLAVLLSGLLTLALSFVALPQADAATGRLTAGDGHTVATGSIGSLSDGSVRAAFDVPGRRAATVTLGLELRRQADGSTYRLRATVTIGGTLRVAVVRYHRTSAKIVTEKTVGSLKAGQRLWLEGSVTGTSPVAVRVRAWVDGRPTPGWQVLADDSSSIRVAKAGSARLVVRLSSARGSKSVTVGYGAVGLVRSTPAPVDSSGRGKPSAATTGVPAGTELTVHQGTIVVTKPGAVLDRMDIHGYVIVRAPNVTISRSIVRGGPDATTAIGLITNYGSPNLLITDTDVRAEFPSVYQDGIKGWNFTARRVHVVGNVDSIKIHGDNVTVRDSLLEDTVWYPHDPYQQGGPTHNDNIQILQGKNLRIIGNTIRGATNFAVLGAANKGDVPDLEVRGNWLDGGHCTLKLQIIGQHALTATVDGNKFGPHRAVSYCPMQVLPGVQLTEWDNVSEDTGLPVQIWRRP
ncbi:MAG TPA: hypothetical protein VFP34_10120 [Microlunatus sp.]|nr:hypothetical protein [Microlunatus sp.]